MLPIYASKPITIKPEMGALIHTGCKGWCYLVANYSKNSFIGKMLTKTASLYLPQQQIS